MSSALNITLADVKNALGITGEYLDNTIKPYFNEVVSVLTNAGVKENNITVGVIARGVSDLWNYGSGSGELSPYFFQRAAQLKLI